MRINSLEKRRFKLLKVVKLKGVFKLANITIFMIMIMILTLV